MKARKVYWFMNKKIAGLILISILSCNSWGIAQNNTDFRLTVTTWEYSTHIFTGDVEYMITPDTITITRKTSINNDRSIEVSEKLNPSESLSILSKMDLSIFESFYDTGKIMPTSGQMIYVEYEKGGATKNITFHSYCSKLLLYMTGVFNRIVPEEFKVKIK